MLVARTRHLLGRYRVLFTSALALSLLHCGATTENSQDDLHASDGTPESTTGSSTAASDETGSEGTSGGSKNPSTSDTATDTSTTGELPTGTDGASPAGPNLDGDWGLFLFEDPVAVSLQQDGEVLSGYGCCIPDQIAENYCCGPIEGSIHGNQVSFSFPLSDGGDRYRAEVVVSEDGTRMGGSLFRDRGGEDSTAPILKGAWLRYDSFERNWLTTYPELEDELSSLEGLSSLRLSADSEAGDGFVHDQEYRLIAAMGGVGGDLGPFWGSEVSVREDDDAIVAGPVPATDPSLPASLVLRRSGSTLLDAEMTMASGATYHFEVMPPDDP